MKTCLLFSVLSMEQLRSAPETCARPTRIEKAPHFELRLDYSHFCQSCSQTEKIQPPQ